MKEYSRSNIAFQFLRAKTAHLISLVCFHCCRFSLFLLLLLLFFFVFWLRRGHELSSPSCRHGSLGSFRAEARGVLWPVALCLTNTARLLPPHGYLTGCLMNTWAGARLCLSGGRDQYCGQAAFRCFFLKLSTSLDFSNQSLSEIFCRIQLSARHLCCVLPHIKNFNQLFVFFRQHKRILKNDSFIYRFLYYRVCQLFKVVLLPGNLFF